MLKALDENNNRILPEKGKKGFCQLCNNNVRAYCGEIYIDHWRHIVKENCDSWNEGETDWHREWKNEFPDDWQEVIITKGNEKHIADVKTPKNLVLELQNSSISTYTIKIREKFYDKMIWLINANNFKDNIVISSIVKLNLKKLDELQANLIYHDSKSSFEEQALKERIEIESQLRKLERIVFSLENQLKDVKWLLDNFKTAYKKLIDSELFYSFLSFDFLKNDKIELSDLNKKLENLEEELNVKQNFLFNICQLENCNVENYKDFKYVDQNRVKPSSFSKCALIERASHDTFFPNIYHFKSEIDFKRISKNPKYRLIINLGETIKNTESEMDIILKDKEFLLEKIFEKNENIKNKFRSYLKKINNEFNDRLNTAHGEISKLNKALNSKNMQIEILERNKYQAKEEELKSVVKKISQERYDIMKKYKGLYSYRWKHKRKSWDFSEKKIYFDFENAIFEMIDSNTLRKLSRSEFIQIIINS